MLLSLSHSFFLLSCYPFLHLAPMTHTTHAYGDEASLCNLCRRTHDTSLAFRGLRTLEDLIRQVLTMVIILVSVDSRETVGYSLDPIAIREEFWCILCILNLLSTRFTSLHQRAGLHSQLLLHVRESGCQIMTLLAGPNPRCCCKI